MADFGLTFFTELVGDVEHRLPRAVAVGFPVADVAGFTPAAVAGAGADARGATAAAPPYFETFGFGVSPGFGASLFAAASIQRRAAAGVFLFPAAGGFPAGAGAGAGAAPGLFRAIEP